MDGRGHDSEHHHVAGRRIVNLEPGVPLQIERLDDPLDVGLRVLVSLVV